MAPNTQAPLTPFSAYQERLDSGTITPDIGQEQVIQSLQILYNHISDESFLKERNRLLSLFVGSQATPARCGVYVWGDVGRGKSMLMDMFYELVPFKQKRRIHFHAFMLNVHKRMHAWRKLKPKADLIALVVRELSSEFRLLCLDEFQVHDITNAMILSRLFTALFEEGIVVVITSNRPPEDLYLNGLQREQFLPFIDLINERMDVQELISDTDYRMQQLQALHQTYYFPLGEAADDYAYSAYQQLTHAHPSTPVALDISGRTLHIEKTACGVAWMTYEELCQRALGAADYIELATVFHTIILQHVPQMSREQRNEAKRFVTLIDALYEHKVKLIITADVAPEELYPEGDGSFEFHRTVSRLHEMQSEKYLKSSHIV